MKLHFQLDVIKKTLIWFEYRCTAPSSNYLTLRAARKGGWFIHLPRVFTTQEISVLRRLSVKPPPPRSEVNQAPILYLSLSLYRPHLTDKSRPFNTRTKQSKLIKKKFVDHLSRSYCQFSGMKLLFALFIFHTILIDKVFTEEG